MCICFIGSSQSETKLPKHLGCLSTCKALGPGSITQPLRGIPGGGHQKRRPDKPAYKMELGRKEGQDDVNLRHSQSKNSSILGSLENFQ